MTPRFLPSDDRDARSTTVVALERLQRDKGRFAAFFRQVNNRFARQARRLYPWSRDADIEDALQSALLSLFEPASAFSLDDAARMDDATFDARVAGYVTGAATKQLITRLRKLGVESVRLTSLEQWLENEHALDALLSDLGELAPSPEAAAILARTRAAVERCLSKLTETARETFMLALGGHKDVEIQQMTKAGSPVSVRRRISEAKARVIACVQDQTGETA
ncbi:RNA polymerase sigma factor [Burkholderia aenigmatica]|uniref:Sigma-70 family RNA polymerase sigma factor n=1 Tax=Burkholderia aenigmatica TaxID=2015348 RepID=A0A228HT16_9BURK|nr:sigma-70 family RNA polymerase sigma factor [Burkholderia aenigmatica]OXI33320.1 hypothetical protein CFB84_39645 [Burkholderia aenigmatica]